ncbi:MAG: hypothetical protein CSA65_06630 [Proteobacteria bacterium]|nr:MAG: hypothetical protein CSA65_06630 [Pseudomonadota bacterium]
MQMARWIGVAVLALVFVACGDKGQRKTGRGAPKVGQGGKPGTVAGGGAETPAPTPAPKALPSAFRRGRSREQVMKMLPQLSERRFHCSIVAFETRKLFSAWMAVSKHLAQYQLGKRVLKELEREGRRVGVLLPTHLAEAKRWGISLTGPSFVVLRSSRNKTVVGYSVADLSRFKDAILALHDRGRGEGLYWESEPNTKPPLTALRQGASVRAICRFSRGFALCGYRRDVVHMTLARQGSLWDDLDPKERAALSTQSGLLTVGERNTGLLSFWRLDDKRRMHVSGRVGGAEVRRAFAQIKPTSPPRLATIAGKVATAWARLPIALARSLDPKKDGLDGKQLAQGFDGEVALAEGAGGEVAAVLGVRDRKAAKQVVEGLLRQLQGDGMWSNLTTFAVRKRKQAHDKTLGRYELIDVRCTEPLVSSLKLRLALVWGQDRLVIGTPKQALLLARGKAVAPKGVHKKKDDGALLSLRLPLGDLLAPLLATMPKLFALSGKRLPPRELDLLRMLPRSFRRGTLRLRLKGAWLRGEGRLDVASAGRYDGQTSSAARAGLWALMLVLSRVERASRARFDLRGLRWQLRRFVRKHKRLPPGKTGWLPKKRCCQLPGGVCPPRALAATALGKAGFRSYSPAHQWRYTCNKKGDKATLEARADLDCDGRFATHKVEISLQPGQRQHLEVSRMQSKQRFE